jgi:hypothetical protein
MSSTDLFAPTDAEIGFNKLRRWDLLDSGRMPELAMSELSNWPFGPSGTPTIGDRSLPFWWSPDLIATLSAS